MQPYATPSEMALEVPSERIKSHSVMQKSIDESHHPCLSVSLRIIREKPHRMAKPEMMLLDGLHKLLVGLDVDSQRDAVQVMV